MTLKEIWWLEILRRCHSTVCLIWWEMEDNFYYSLTWGSTSCGTLCLLWCLVMVTENQIVCLGKAWCSSKSFLFPHFLQKEINIPLPLISFRLRLPHWLSFVVQCIWSMCVWSRFCPFLSTCSWGHRAESWSIPKKWTMEPALSPVPRAAFWRAHARVGVSALLPIMLLRAWPWSGPESLSQFS